MADGPALGAGLPLASNVAGAVNIIEASGKAVPHFVGQTGLFIGRVHQLIHVHGDKPLRQREGDRLPHGEIIDFNPIIFRQLIKFAQDHDITILLQNRKKFTKPL